MSETFDVVIIGSGAGGSPIAHTLARAGKSVLVIEKGPLFRTQSQDPRGLSDFKRDELFATGAEKRVQLDGVRNRGEAFFHSHVEPDLNDEPHVYRNGVGDDLVTMEGYTAQVVGGGTQLYGGVSLRFSPTDFRLQSFNRDRGPLPNDPGDEVRREARDWPLGYEELEPYYCRAEELIGICGSVDGQIKPFSRDAYQAPPAVNPLSRYAAHGMDVLGMRRYRTPLAIITEDHAPSGRKAGNPKTGFVNRYGDPLGLKSSTWVSLLAPIASLPNFELRPNCNVTHLGCDGDRVTRVHYRDPGGAPAVVSGRLVIVACSAIESVRLLLLSAEQDPAFSARIHQNDLLGKYFLTHCFGGAEVTTPDRSDKSLSVDSDWATDFCARDEFVREKGMWAGGAIYNNTSHHALPLSLARSLGSRDMDTMWQGFLELGWVELRRSEDMLAFLDQNFGRHLSVSFMANQVPMKSNRIELHPTVRDKWGRKSAYILKDWHPHDRHVMGILASQCAEILNKGVGVDDVRGGAAADAPNGIIRIANHILGGARFGTDPRDSVLDRDCRAWGFDNLYVTDGSFMPSSGGANPTLTIQANSFRVADVLQGRL